MSSESGGTGNSTISETISDCAMVEYEKYGLGGLDRSAKILATISMAPKFRYDMSFPSKVNVKSRVITPTAESEKKREKRWQDYHSAFHTSSKQLAGIANAVHPKTLVLVHQLLFGSTKESLMKEIRQWYKGNVQYGNDLDVIE